MNANRAIVVALWAAVAVVFATEAYTAVATLAQPVPWSRVLAYGLPGWALWALFTPAILFLRRRVPIRRDGTTYALLFHLTASALFALAHAALLVSIHNSIDATLHGRDYVAALQFRLQFASHLDLLTYWLVLGAAQVAAFYREQTDRDLRSARLATGLAEARLELLRMELNPHFLFNTLNAISGLVYTNPRAADRMLARLGELLRHSLALRNQHRVPLEQELKLLQCYMDIEHIRFGDQLRFDVSVPQEARNELVPSLVLQPLVENAVKHGLQAAMPDGLVRIEAAIGESVLQIMVVDNGSGWNGEAANGVGLANTRARLAELYGDSAHLEILRAEPTGTMIRLTIPRALVPSHA